MGLTRKMSIQEMVDNAQSSREKWETKFKDHPTLFPDAPKQIEFYKGFLKAIEIFRKHDYLKGED